FPPSQGITKLRNIAVSVGRTGALTPVAELEPVRIHGVEISSATLHNEDEILRKDIRIGDTVVVERAGDVIPKIARSLPELRTGAEKTFVMPTACPICGAKVVRVEAESAHRCLNTACPARLKQSVLHFISKGGLDIDGMGPKLITQLVDQGIVGTLSDVLTLDQTTLLSLDRFGPKSTDKLLAALESAKNTTLARFLFSLGIPGVGAHLADVLARRFRDLEALSLAAEDDLATIPEIGPISAHGIAAFFASEQSRRLLDDLQAAGLTLKPMSDDQEQAALAGQRFVFTGSLSSMTRSEAGERVKSLGGIVTSSVGKNTDYIILGENPGSKAEKARELGIILLSETAFLEFLKSYE
ncbi:NAD-dependent DNA ligase LigA, partial [Candidatus Bipolaricaulota bacterium]|nr:NAD-dependent DNA ligase LigA [Candidatus Bipolaricaulota bacterium]